MANYISLHNLTYLLPKGNVLFDNISDTFAANKIGLVGINGSGKSTLLQLIAGQLQPTRGHITVHGSIGYCHQLDQIKSNYTVQDLLGITDIIYALSRIEAGSVNGDDFLLVENNWEIRQNIEALFSQLGLHNIQLTTPLMQLSGGERTQIALARTLRMQHAINLLDEPTNNLDSSARNRLLCHINESNSNFIIASHDRTLLSEMDEVIEINKLSLTRFGGNYQHYKNQKEIMTHAAIAAVVESKKALTKAKRSIQATREKHEQRQSKGRKQFLSGSIDKLSANSKKGQSEHTQAALSITKTRLMEQAYNDLTEKLNEVDCYKSLRLSLPSPKIGNDQLVFELDNVTFQYPGCSTPIISALSFIIRGPERLSIVGANGSGKSTLLKLMTKVLQVTTGAVRQGQIITQYLDQSCLLLNPDDSIIENFLRLNPEYTSKDAHFILADFLFRNTDCYKNVSVLSGGEKLRATLACILMAKEPPSCIILDEPTNHLDITSIQHIESALRQYKGALVVVSHDKDFLKEIGIERQITLI